MRKSKNPNKTTAVQLLNKPIYCLALVQSPTIAQSCVLSLENQVKKNQPDWCTRDVKETDMKGRNGPYQSLRQYESYKSDFFSLLTPRSTDNWI